MTTFAWLGVLALLGAIAHLAIWSRAGTWARPAAVILFVLGIPAVGAAGLQSLGHHLPLKMAWELPPGEHRVLAAKMVQDEAIFLYLETGRNEPWPLQIPWSNDMANRIQKLQDEGDPDAKGQFMMRFEPSLDLNAEQFHPLPQPPMMPPKPRQEAPPHIGQDA